MTAATLKISLLAMALFTFSSSLKAQTTNVIPLWPNGAPGAVSNADRDIPTLTAFLPANNATNAALIVCPGGGYASLANHEGAVYAQWLTNQGIAAFVLKYRLGSAGYRHPIEMQDAARAIRLVRARAAEWK